MASGCLRKAGRIITVNPLVADTAKPVGLKVTVADENFTLAFGFVVRSVSVPTFKVPSEPLKMADA